MKHRRLHWLLAAMVALALLRWLLPPNTVAPAALSEAVPRNNGQVRVLESEPISVGPVPKAPTISSAQEPVTPAGNAFAVRGASTPPAVAPTRTAQPVPSSGPAPELAASEEPPLALQVIGTWIDEQGLAVFVATPSGAQMARPGMVLLGDFSVVRVTPQTLSLRQVSTNRDLHLPVPRQPRS
jgi:hypothetical protein